MAMATDHSDNTVWVSDRSVKHATTCVYGGGGGTEKAGMALRAADYALASVRLSIPPGAHNFGLAIRRGVLELPRASWGRIRRSRAINFLTGQRVSGGLMKMVFGRRGCIWLRR